MPALSEEADRSEAGDQRIQELGFKRSFVGFLEAATAKERQRLAELQKWLKEFGQHEEGMVFFGHGGELRSSAKPFTYSRPQTLPQPTWRPRKLG